MLIRSVLIAFVVVISSKLVLSQSCSCEDGSTGAIWGRVEAEFTLCTGICDLATQTVRRQCMLTDGGSASCTVTNHNCLRISSCNGLWSQWGNAEECNNGCGDGFQRQTRSCYKRGTNMRARYCNGSRGSSDEQSRQNPCTRRTRCSETTTISTSSTTTTTTTVTPATTDPPSESSGGSIQSDPQDPLDPPSPSNDGEEPEQTTDGGPPSQPPPPPPPPSTGKVDVLTLAAVLGSVGLVCIALIIVVVIVVRRRRARKPGNSQAANNTYNAANDVPSNRTYVNSGSTPALPPDRAVRYKETPRTESYQPVPTGVYASASDNNDLQISFGNDELYLEPLPSPTKPSNYSQIVEGVDVSEGIYFSIDDYTK